MSRARLLMRVLVIIVSAMGALGITGLLWQPAQSASLSSPSNSPSSVDSDDQVFDESLANNLLINEVDATTPGSDIAEFVELYDGGQGYTSLDGLVLVLFNGQDDQSYNAFGLGGYQSDAEGYFLLGNQGVSGVDLIFANAVLQGGPDAVALYQGTAADFPNGTAVTTANLIDAVVYGSGDDDDNGLLILLQPGEPQVNEDSRTLADFHSNQRCPNGGGEPRRTQNYLQGLPTPKAANACPADLAPQVSGINPLDGSEDVALGNPIVLTFSEAVEVSGSWFEINCTYSGQHAAVVSGGDTVYMLDPLEDFAHGESCTVSIVASQITDKDTDDPPDEMTEDFNSSFSTIPANTILINEVDADTPGVDAAEFIELSDGGSGATNLGGLVVVLYNGIDDRSYKAIDLDGRQTTDTGYFVIGNSAVTSADLIIPDGMLQNGADALALYAGSAADFPNGTAVTTNNLLDALVYDTADDDDPGLLSLLLAGEPQVDENGRGNNEGHSNQRCPNGEGGQRRSSSYLQNPPTPGASNQCIFDAAPEVIGTIPVNEATAVPINAAITVAFSEPVTAAEGWFDIACTNSGSHEAATGGSDTNFSLDPLEDFVNGEVCTVTVFADKVYDLDGDDPPNFMAADYQWIFSTPNPPPAMHLMINEVDADTPGVDTAEFIELSDGGSGATSLDGLIIVFYNGSDDRSYAAIDLDGRQTTAAGYFVIGNTAVTGVDLIIPGGMLQNGADAVALYAGSTADFPNGTAVTTSNLLDALVYDTADSDDPGLLPLLLNGEPQVNESGRLNPMGDSNQRCPDSSGQQRRTSAYLQNLPTPGASNKCTFDSAPQVSSTTPQDGASNVAIDSTITIRFSEAVTLSPNWFEINCTTGGPRTTAVSGGGTTYVLTPHEALARGDSCTVTLLAVNVHDNDGDDPPDLMTADYQWGFSTVSAPVADHVIINEVDSDTPGADNAEFIEIYDGGAGDTVLDGLVVVLYNGSNDLSYRSFDLDGLSTNSEGYFVLGNEGVAGVDLVFGAASLQNGADALAIYVGHTTDFPNGTAVTTNNLLDALVYDTADDDDPGLLPLLLAGEPQVDEAGHGDSESHSNQRCPNGAGGQRISSNYLQNPATPGAANDCTTDPPPFGACGDAATPIHLIQGDGLSTPLSGMQAIVIEGIVSADFQGPDRLGGFFLQQGPQTMDSDPQTSEGIFVYDSGLGIEVSVSEIVRLQGDVLEVDGLTSISQVIKLEHCGPAPALTPMPVTLPVANAFYWESVEGMLVHITQTLAATGSEALGSEGAVDLALNGRLFYPTEVAKPGEAALATADLNSRSRITLDDGSRQRSPLPLPPYLGLNDTLRVGDTVNGLTGILAENSSGYRIQPTEMASFTRVEQRPLVLPESGGQLRLAHFDTGDYFNGDGKGGGFPGERGAQTAEEFSRQRVKVINAIFAMQADVVALSGVENDGYGPYSALQDLIDGLNEEAGGTFYALVDPGLPQLGQTVTAVGLIYRSERVVPLGTAVTTGTTPFDAPNSQPLVQAFTAAGSGESFVVAAVQLLGREVCPPEGNANSDQGDGQGCYALLRAQTAVALAAWLETDPGGSGADDILILGNLNAYSQEDPVAELQGAGYTNLATLLAPGSGYTSVTGGETGTLNYALASPGMAAHVQDMKQWHINAGEPRALDYREDNQPQLYHPGPYRSATQDPLIVDLNLAPLVARFDSDTPVRIGQVMQFWDRSSGSDITEYEWDFGDGSPPETTADTQHLYTAVGSYQVTLIIRTALGVTRVYGAPVEVTPMKLFFPVTSAK